MRAHSSFIRFKTRHLVLLSAFFILGCASYQKNVESSRDLMVNNKFDDALVLLKAQSEKAKGDRLAYMLEEGTVLHQAKRYAESNKIFAAAEKEAQLNDYVSLSREFGSIFVQEGLVQYKVESFEYLLINIYQAMNYIMLKDYENAQVMARKINEKIVKLEVDGDSRKRHTGFATYIAAIMWESQNDWDNAYVLYKKAQELLPDIQILNTDLLRAAKISGRGDDYERLKKKWPELDKKIGKFNPRKDGEFVFIYQQGWIPRKAPRYDNHRFPMMVPVASNTKLLHVAAEKTSNVDTEKVFDLERVAIQTLDDDFGRLMAKKVAGIAGKAVIANQIDKKNKGLGTLAFIALDAMDQADLRQWSTLPASFQIVRLPLAPGKHTIAITADPNAPPIWTGEVEIKKGQKHFFTLRTF